MSELEPPGPPSADEEHALETLRHALVDQEQRGGGPFRLIAIASMLAVGGVVAVGIVFFSGYGRPTKPTTQRDPFVCEELLAAKTEADRNSFYFCSPGPGEMVRIKGERQETQRILANAVYELDLDGATRIVGIAAPGARYGWDGKVCTSLAATYAAGAVPLASPPVDLESCRR
jgi:hypothetical protein